MSKFKTFTPKVDSKRRLVMTRFYTGVKNSNSFCYVIDRINLKGEKDKKFKSLYSFGTDDFKSVEKFSHSVSGQEVKVYKSTFKSVFKVKEKGDPVSIWKTIK